MKKYSTLLLLLLLSSAILFAGGEQEPVTGEAEEQVTGEQIGGTVSVLAVWGGQELEVFQEMIRPFEQRTGIQVQYEGTRDIEAVLTTRLQAGNPPDIAMLPGPGQMADFARQGHLVDLSTILDMDQIQAAYAEGWLELGTVDGQLVGMFNKAALKGLVWYNPDTLQELGILGVAAGEVQLPQTWDDLLEISLQIADQGQTPWAIGLESGAASGWAGTDWLENIFVRLHGPELYREWYEGRLEWTSEEVRTVWQMWGQIVGDSRMVYGGTPYVLSTNFGQAFEPLFTEPPQAYFHHQASFIQGFIQEQFPELTPGEDYNFFGFPAAQPEYANTIVSAGDIVGMFNQTPQAEELMRYLASAEAQAYWTRGAGAMSANRNVTLEDYPDVLSRNAAQILQAAEIVVFDASDLMPGEMNTAFWNAVLNYVNNPDDLDSILQNLEQVRQETYQQR